MNDFQNISKKLISENDLNLKKFKGENEKIIKEIDNINNGKLSELEEKIKILDRKCNTVNDRGTRHPLISVIRSISVTFLKI